MKKTLKYMIENWPLAVLGLFCVLAALWIIGGK